MKRKALQVGDKVLNGRYEISRIIHTSGMANVYLVIDSSLGKTWCLKEVIKSEAGREDIERLSLIEEANIMKDLSHSSIPRIVTIEEDGDSIFIVMDYVDGISIKSWLKKKGRIDQDIVVKWMKQVCGVMIYLHNRNKPILYRDMKPDNVMIQSDGNIKVLDFGISIVTENGTTVIEKALGTRGYAAPEQSKRGNVCDLRADIFALGRTMYYMLTGISPSVVKGELKPIRDIDSSLSLGLEIIIDKCCKPNPDDRYQTVEEVLYALGNIDKLDESYKRAVKKKIKVVGSLLIGSLGLFTLSFIPYGIYRTGVNNRYTEMVNTAMQTGRVSDYIDAISIKPKNILPYLGLVDTVKSDGVFSVEEEEEILSVINVNLSDLKNKKEYGQFAFNMGKLYWFYYGGTDGKVVSTKWFKEAMNNDFNTKESKMFYEMGMFEKTVSMAKVESSDKGIYKDYWYNLLSAKELDNSEIVELQLLNSIADTIIGYRKDLNKDGVSDKDIKNEVSKIKAYIDKVSPSTDKGKELETNLSKKLDKIGGML